MLHRFILVLAIVHLILFAWQNRERFLRPYDYNYFGKLYTNSQYVQGEKTHGGIGDDGLYAFAGYYYITGGDISQVSFESPPLAKYLIGISILLFHNELVINLFYVLGLIAVVYKLGTILTKNKTLSALAVLLVSIDPLFTSQYGISMLDLPMTILFLGGVYFFLNKNFLLSALLFSLSFATRFFPILPILLGILLWGLHNKDKQHFWSYFVSLIILMPLVYVFVHLRYIIDNSLIDFLRYQYWIIHWRFGEPFIPGNMLTTILTGYYRSWWQGNIWLRRTDWSILIPLNFIFGTIGLWQWRKKSPTKILPWMILIYIIYCTLGTVGVTKFLLPIYPLIVIASIQTIYAAFRKLSKAWRIQK